MQRSKRTPGEGRVNDPNFQRFLQQIRANSTEIGECGGRVLRLKPRVSSNARPEEINAVLEALKLNWRVEVLYIQNFELVRTRGHPRAPAPLTQHAQPCTRGF